MVKKVTTLAVFVFFFFSGGSWAFAPGSSKKKKGHELRAQQEAIVGLGCFWEPSEKLLGVEGVLGTTCGYAGGARNPTYDQVCAGDGNVEAVKVVFDDAVISYEGVLSEALKVAKCNPYQRQYAPVVFTRSTADHDRATAWAATDKAGKKNNFTPRDFQVERVVDFWRAETYHQQFWQKWRPRLALMAGLFLLQWVWADAVYYRDDIEVLLWGALTLAVCERYVWDVDVRPE
mmetsp:Transcript_32846/g.104756  ORF Transcript_32846/g.104756 Transcript_32846/m.104756 type:complete len:232 (+) Transcript_32846:1505-2200(+)